jgi:hypothetical protein
MENETKIKLIGVELQHMRKAINLMEGIKAVCKNWDTKKVNMRLNTQLKNLDKDLYLKIEYNSFIIGLYNFDNRRVTTSKGCTEYAKNYDLSIIHAALSSCYANSRGIMQEGVFKYDVLIEQIDKAREYFLKYIQETEDNLKNLEFLKIEQEKLKLLIKEFNNKVGHCLNNYFDLRIK